jgi:hypothetical protein
LTFAGTGCDIPDGINFTRLRTFAARASTSTAVQMSGVSGKFFRSNGAKRNGGKFIAKGEAALDSQAGCGCLSPGERGLNRGDTRSGTEQGPAATSGGVARKRCFLQPGGRCFSTGCRERRPRRDRRRLRNGGSKPAVDVASWDGNPLPEGPGRDGSWLCAKHDSPPGRP